MWLSTRRPSMSSTMADASLGGTRSSPRLADAATTSLHGVISRDIRPAARRRSRFALNRSRLGAGLPAELIRRWRWGGSSGRVPRSALRKPVSPTTVGIPSGDGSRRKSESAGSSVSSASDGPGRADRTWGIVKTALGCGANCGAATCRSGNTGRGGEEVTTRLRRTTRDEVWLLHRHLEISRALMAKDLDHGGAPAPVDQSAARGRP